MLVEIYIEKNEKRFGNVDIIRMQHALLKCYKLKQNCGYRNNCQCLFTKKQFIKDGNIKIYNPKYCRFEH